MREKTDRIFKVTERLPDNGQKCLCFGHKTFCCEEDMERNADWHEVTFSFFISSYKLKSSMPKDLDDSVIEEIDVVEMWTVDKDEHVIGVTEWKRIN